MQDKDELEARHREQVAKLQEVVKSLSNENQNLRSEIVAMNRKNNGR